MELLGRVAVITGAGSGLGRAAAIRLAKQGAQVALLDMDESRLTALADELGEDALAVQTNVADPDSVAAAIEAVLGRFGQIDVCLNAAGVATPGAITNGQESLPLETFRKVIEINLIGLFDVMRQCVTAMASNEPVDGERGVIINVSSGAWDQGQRGQAAYASSKAGVVGLTLPVARDVAKFGVRVVAIAPGLFDTSMASFLPDKVRARLEKMILQPSRLGHPEEFAALVLHIVENQYFNATTISLDAGVRMS
ncbi:NAD(P)-dependent dehydrogenase (short-subunit alcohol dehydrogenase family) [Antricoccus suffuscus]|uniref:NAD(P)-dependent dehydrogenase (Short-subunit alcohol dehydrogenase family) n=1 Tax=Antricoccus suffuscus TaxID=1629062 RepID=A0A2T0ZTT6_9ACTN|nr:SDR family NAD(P)-dependent oxidoreductase [Antricoccus suffuscus]PRZ39704.1 NAD(P)-dependent dehydrogenase (short-subunit alcohol dehydrogenase family) [Antricoccus suffuscus]